MHIPVYFVRAFTDSVFGGNPAAVCPLETWLPDSLMQAIAAENAVAETAFVVPVADAENPGHLHIRWFTPEIEMDLCGHATLSAAHVLHRMNDRLSGSLLFESSSGPLGVDLSGAKDGDRYTLNFPSRPPGPCRDFPEQILTAFNLQPDLVLQSRDLVLVYPDEASVRALQPNELFLQQFNLDTGGIVATAPGDQADFVSRYFTPGASIFEDPVTGSAHSTLVPYWAGLFGKSRLNARQISTREGVLECQLVKTEEGSRVLLTGQVKDYLQGVISIDGQPTI